MGDKKRKTNSTIHAASHYGITALQIFFKHKYANISFNYYEEYIESLKTMS
jgi:hypothetical protein